MIGLRRAIASAAAIAGAGLLAFGAWLPAASAASGGTPTVTNPQGDPITSGGSATQWGLLLPPGSACPGDSYHDGWLVGSYVAPISTSPSSVYYPDGNTPDTGLNLVNIAGDPYVTQLTQQNTGDLNTPPLFSWSRFDHRQDELPFGSYNVGIACYRGHSPVARYWNVVITFKASATDPGGFTWSVSSQGSSSKSDWGGLDWALPVVAIALIAVVLSLFKRPKSHSPKPAVGSS